MGSISEPSARNYRVTGATARLLRLGLGAAGVRFLAGLALPCAASVGSLSRSVLVGTGIWDRDETVQIVPETATDDSLFRLWGALQVKYRLCTTFRARVIRLGYGDTPTWPAVVASRFGFADTDPLAEPAGAGGG